MASALEPGPRFHARLHHEPGVGLGSVSLRVDAPVSTLAFDATETVWVAFEGELFDVASLYMLIGDNEARPDESQAELALRLYERFGECFAAKLNGAFNIAIWDGRSRKLVLINDRLGLHPLYYARDGGALVFAAGVRALLAHPGVRRTVDLVAVNQFLVHDHVLDDRTFLEAVRLLPQASILTFQGSRCCIRSYWSPRPPHSYTLRSEHEYIDGFVHHIRQAASRARPDGRRAGVLLSGGLDSRYLLALLTDLGEAVETLTFGIRGCDDSRFAAEVSAKVGARHHFVELKDDWLIHMANEAVRLTDGLGNVVNLHALPAVDSSPVEVLYKGFLGDAMFGIALARAMWGEYDGPTGYRVHQAVHREQGYDVPNQQGMFTDAFLGQVGDALGEAYRRSMDRAGVPGLGSQRLFFDLTQRAPRMTLQGVQVARSRTVVRLPYCDNDLLEFSLGVPPGWLLDRHIQKVSFVKQYPELAKIPLAPTRRCLSSCARDLISQSRTLLHWHAHNAGLGWLVGPERRPYKDYRRWFRTVLRPWLEGILLDPRTLDRGYVRPEYLRGLIAEPMAGADHSVRLGALLTLELWHRQALA